MTVPQPDETERVVVRSFAIADSEGSILECSVCGLIGTASDREERRDLSGRHLIDVHNVAVLLMPED